MYTKLASQVGLSNGSSVVSASVPMAGFNAVQVDITVFSGEVRVYVQQTDDLQDWTVKDTYTAVVGPAHKLFPSTGTCCAYVRVMWEEATGSGDAVLCGSVNLSLQ